MMKRLFTACTLMMAGLGALPADAATISGDFSLSGSAFAPPGLVISTDRTSGNFSQTLNVGQSVTFNLFRLWTNESRIKADDRIADTLIAQFSLPAYGATGAVSGSTVGNSFFFNILQWGTVSWAQPLVLNFGRGGAVQIALNNAAFNVGLFGLSPGSRYGANINATMTLISEPAAVPLPAAGLLLAGALGALGLKRRRRAA